MGLLYDTKDFTTLQQLLRSTLFDALDKAHDEIAALGDEFSIEVSPIVVKFVRKPRLPLA